MREGGRSESILPSEIFISAGRKLFSPLEDFERRPSLSPSLSISAPLTAIIGFIGIRLQKCSVTLFRASRLAGANASQDSERSITLPFEIPRYKGHDLDRVPRQFRSKFRSTWYRAFDCARGVLRDWKCKQPSKHVFLFSDARLLSFLSNHRIYMNIKITRGITKERY